MTISSIFACVFKPLELYTTNAAQDFCSYLIDFVPHQRPQHGMHLCLLYYIFLQNSDLQIAEHIQKLLMLYILLPLPEQRDS